MIISLLSRSRSTSRPALTAAAAAAAVVALAGCGSPEQQASAAAPQSGESRTVTTMLGEVTVPATIDKVVVLEGRRDLDIALSLGLPVTGVAAMQPGEMDLPAPIPAKLTAGAKELFLRGQVNLEAIAAAAPDVIISRFSDVEPIRAELSAIAPVLVVGDQDTSTWQDDLRLVAKATGREDRATELITAYDNRVAGLKKTYADVLKDNTFAPMNYDLESDSTDTRAKRLLSTVMTDVGMKPSAAWTSSLDGTKAEYGPEQLKVGYGDADGIVAIVSEPKAWAQVQAKPLFKQLPAVAQGHVVRSDRRTHEGAALTADAALDVVEQLLKTF
ncbi:iron complex transport system substrate-binding protein [Knoellia remsis]|uniref:Iron complex transport system substrate-binding protein n=1 Tax=Knoellia remsis TaxID=407159 RepID=A0A2T0ULE1_9MICO|nr:ABC transporter substrate-binding protein [Knoellia remsis]PRY58753.1 iron complex transport system substrate-binding protein [Knoellia remsis]